MQNCFKMVNLVTFPIFKGLFDPFSVAKGTILALAAKGAWLQKTGLHTTVKIFSE